MLKQLGNNYVKYWKKNKMVLPHKRFQGQGHVKKWPTVVARLMLIGCRDY